jgi:DEAD/DEAH box helicase domain-containing protein
LDLDLDDPILVSPEPHFEHNIRAVQDPSYDTVTGPSGVDSRIGSINYSQVLREAYPKAVYWHMGSAYRVTALLHAEHKIRVKRESRRKRTFPIGRVEVIARTTPQNNILRTLRWGDHLEMQHTAVSVSTLTSGYREQQGGKWTWNEVYPNPLRRRVVSEGIWLRLHPEFGPRSIGGLNALAHAVGNVYMIVDPCDVMDMATHSVLSARDGCSYIYWFDTVPGGLGITERVFDSFRDLLDLADERIRTCTQCDPDPSVSDRGCPACIHVPRWYEDNEHLSKAEALDLIASIRNTLEEHGDGDVFTSREYRIRHEGRLSSVEPDALRGVQQMTGGKHWRRQFAPGSLLRTSDTKEGTVGRTFVTHDGLRAYELSTEAEPITYKDLGRNLSLIDGDVMKECLNCGSDSLPFDSSRCPNCNADFSLRGD